MEKIKSKVDLKDKKTVLGILDTIDDMFDTTEKVVKEYVQDKTIDLENRWEVFCRAGNLGLIGTNTMFFHPKGVTFNWGAGTLEDLFHIRIGQGYDVVQLLKDCQEGNLISSVIEYKESCMQEFIFEAINDW
ncbi:MAG: hypothetical protein GY775_16660 [Candidatus Scalindua sp.]|nr:hypothetical protein [Candidatus Scalindua sp.]